MAETDDRSGIRFFGAEPIVVAQLDEIERVRQTLLSVAQNVNLAEENLSLLWIADPQQLVQLGALSRELDYTQQLALRLARDCEVAASAYLTTESQLLGMFARYSDSALLSDQARGWFTASLGVAAMSSLGHPAGNWSLRTMTSTLLPNRGGSDLPIIANQIAAVIAGSGAGILPERGDAAAISHFESSCAQDSAQLAERLLALDGLEEPVIQIDEVHAGSQRTLFVFIPGTRSWSLGGENPLDMQSNIFALGLPGLAASEAATIAALGLLGLQATDRMVLVGHSQGGLVAKNIAATHPLQTQGVVTFGAPVLPSHFNSVPAIVFEHDNDPVPALAGLEKDYPLRAMSVSRPAPGTQQFEGHAMAEYLQTARIAVEQHNEAFSNLQRQILGDPNSETVQTCQSHRFSITRAGRPASD